jgi:hypothetical protein
MHVSVKYMFCSFRKKVPTRGILGFMLRQVYMSGNSSRYYFSFLNLTLGICFSSLKHDSSFSNNNYCSFSNNDELLDG